MHEIIIAFYMEQEKVKHIITCFTKALLHVLNVYILICTGFCTFLTTIF